MECKRPTGFFLMADAESPAPVFEFLYVFMPPDMRKRVAYDNGCNLLRYALNRDPRFVAMLLVLIDAFHAPNHHACAAAFNTGARPTSRLPARVQYRRDSAAKE